MKNHVKASNLLISTFIFTLGLTSCGGGGNSDDGSSNTGSGGNTALNGTKVGLVTAAESAGEVELDATFMQLSRVFTEQELRANLKPTALDVCTVTPITGSGSSGSSLDSNLVTISAGNSVLFSDPIGGAFATLTKQDILGVLIYTYDNNGNNPLLAPIPDNLTFDLTGDVFPAFTNASVPSIEAITSASPSGLTPFAIDTTFTWSQPISSATSFMEITFNTAASGIHLECLVVDDGEFVFPQTTQNELTAAGFTASFGIDYVRKEVNFIKQGDDYLVVERQASR